jgi:hypothetical protein
MHLGKSCYFVGLVAIALSSIAFGQVPAPTLNPAPLERPASLVALSTTDAKKTFGQVRAKVESLGFKLNHLDNDAFTLDAQKTDERSPMNYDRIILWLELTAQNPGKRVNLYLLYGRYEAIFGKPDALRVVVSKDVEDQRIGSLKMALLALADN